ncbi:acyl-CoA carboxylase subunit epsilon [Nocardioides sp. GXQ0305]|uniref:acyl-CoA carboxylase subunit epsilon n=1 Tax=Nocardioides sp. GXQ0305 TaxID=3423912 RepID=UPI003D7C3C16
MSDDEESETPRLRILTPDTTPEEVAAIVAVLSAMSSGGPGRPRRRTEWNSPYRQVRPFYSHGPGGWRSSGLPKHRGRGT